MISLAGLLESFDLRYSHLLETTIRITANRQDLLEAVKRMIFNMRVANTDDHGKNHAFLFDPRKAGWALSPAYYLTLNYSIENRCHGLLATTFGASPQRSSMVELALEFAILENEFDEIDAQVVEAIHRWPEFARAAGLPAEQEMRAKALHAQMADCLRSRSLASPRRSRKRLF